MDSEECEVGGKGGTEDGEPLQVALAYLTQAIHTHPHPALSTPTTRALGLAHTTP